MDPVTIAASGMLVLLGFVLGRIPRRTSKTPKPPKPICGCGHHHAHHDPKAGICHGTRQVPSKYNVYGEVIARKEVPCTCKQYSGPEPLKTFFAPELTE